jgi:hypothetical protein
LIAPAFEGAPPSEIVGQVLGGDAVEAGEPLLEAAVAGVDVIDMEVRRLGGRLSRGGYGMERNPGFAGESGDRLPAAVADEMIARRDDPGERCFHRSAVELRQDRVEGRALPVASDENGNVVRMEARMPGRSAPFARLARQIGPPALEGFKDEGFVRLDDSAQLSN